MRFLPVLSMALAVLMQVAGAAPIQVSRTITFNEADLDIRQFQGYDAVRLLGGGFTQEPGRPMLPAVNLRFAVPEGMEVTGVRWANENTVELPGEYTVFPAQRPRLIDGSMEQPEFVEPDPGVYSSHAVFPAERVRFIGQSDLAGQSFATIRVHPVRYVPGLGRLTLITSLEITLEGVHGRECGDYLPRNITDRGRATYERVLRTMVENPEDVRLTSSMETGSRGVEPGQYDYVIITKSDWVDDFQPLADWRNKEGFKATIVTTEWIFSGGGYSGTSLEQMRSFVQDAHTTWGVMYFLLGGDSDLFPYDVDTIDVTIYDLHVIANYTYYADFDDDWVLEVYVGNASVRSVSDINTYLNKVFTYEKNPPLDYTEWAAFLGFDTQYCGDGDGELFKEGFIRPYVPADWTINTEYDSEPGTHLTDVIGYFNQGHHLVNHHDHCNQECMGMGWICHGEVMYTSHVQALTNGDRQSIVVAIGCYPADFSYHTCIGEAFLRNPNGGAVAFFGNTCFGWGGAWPNPDQYGLGQDRNLWRNLFEYGIDRLGENFTMAKNDEYDPYDPYNLHKVAFLQFHLLADPGLSVWTDEPESLFVVHDATMLTGQTQTFEVQVSNASGPVDGVNVCLWKDGDIHMVEGTVGGTATFEVTPMSEGTLYVTANGQNCLPCESEADVMSGLCGDANGDALLTTGDGFRILNYFGAGPEPISCWAANVNGDDNMTTGDGFHVLNFFGGGPALDCAPCEF
jgi:hypothetical protein